MGLSPTQRWMVAGLAALCSCYVAGALTTSPSLFPDPARGFLVERAGAQGAPWNHYFEPSPEDISQDRSYFNAAWSPGQNMVPAVLVRAGLSWGEAMRTVNIVASLAGLLGWFLLHRALGFDLTAALAAALLIAAARTFAFPFLTYIGGELLAFAAFPYLALAVLKVQGSPWLIAVAPVTMMAGFFFKHSLAIYMAGWTAAVVAIALGRRPRPAGRVVAAVAVAAVLVGTAWLIEWGYASRGWSAITYQPVWSGDPAAYLVAWAMPLLAATGIDHVLSRILDHPQSLQFDYRHSLWFLIPTILASGWILWAAQRIGPLRETVRMAVLATVAIVVVFSGLLVTGSANELYLSRHYVIAGFVLLPILIQSLRLARSVAIRRAGAVCLLVPALYGVGSFASNWRRHFDGRAMRSTVTGVAHLSTSPAVLKAFHALDSAGGPTTLVVLPQPSLVVEFAQARVLATGAAAERVEDVGRHQWRGRADNLVVVTEDAAQDPAQIREWLAAFPSYPADGWSRVTVDGYSFHVPAGQVMDAHWLDAHVVGVARD